MPKKKNARTPLKPNFDGTITVMVIPAGTNESEKQAALRWQRNYANKFNKTWGY